MGELTNLWFQAKSNLTDQQKARLPKADFRKKCQEFEAGCDKANTALVKANEALSGALHDGEESFGRTLEEIKKVSRLPANKDIEQVIGRTFGELDKAQRKLFKNLIADFKKTKETADEINRLA
jgi:hypothetical protein